MGTREKGAPACLHPAAVPGPLRDITAGPLAPDRRLRMGRPTQRDRRPRMAGVQSNSRLHYNAPPDETSAPQQAACHMPDNGPACRLLATNRDRNR